MRSYASVILHLLAPITPSILLLDEPEAFLHPPQARLLGEIIAAERPSRAQLVVATHSPDVLHGLMNRMWLPTAFGCLGFSLKDCNGAFA